MSATDCVTSRSLALDRRTCFANSLVSVPSGTMLASSYLLLFSTSWCLGSPLEAHATKCLDGRCCGENALLQSEIQVRCCSFLRYVNMNTTKQSAVLKNLGCQHVVVCPDSPSGCAPRSHLLPPRGRCKVLASWSLCRTSQRHALWRCALGCCTRTCLHNEGVPSVPPFQQAMGRGVPAESLQDRGLFSSVPVANQITQHMFHIKVCSCNPQPALFVPNPKA